MPEPDAPVPADVEGDDGGDHDVPTELVEIHEAIDYLKRAELGPNEAS